MKRNLMTIITRAMLTMAVTFTLTVITASAQYARRMMVNDADRAFMSEAATGGLAEVDLGRLASRKAASADVKAFAQRMVRDHSKANAELKSLASKKRVALPEAMTDEQKAEKAKLQKLSGADFDREYMSMMVEDHDKDVAAFQDKSSSANDADLRALVSKTLPILQEHQRLAHEIKGKM